MPRASRSTRRTPAVKPTELPESTPGIRAHVQEAKTRLRAALLPVLGAGEADLPFGLSRIRLEGNRYLLRFEERARREGAKELAALIEELLKSGLAETNTTFYLDDRPGCHIRQHLAGGGWFDRA